jgi:hypothetical protein
MDLIAKDAKGFEDEENSRRGSFLFFAPLRPLRLTLLSIQE